MVCVFIFVFVFLLLGISAEPASAAEGTAYAILLSEPETVDGETYDAGTFIFIRSPETSASGGTIQDYDGNSYTGTIFTDFEDEDFSAENLPPWKQSGSITSTSITRVVFKDFIQPQSTAYWFAECQSLTTVSGGSNLNTTHATNMEAMFLDCRSLTSIEGTDSWDISSVTNMTNMFMNCNSLTTLDVSTWDTSYAQNMTGMFAYCMSLTSLDVSGFNTSNVTSMQMMFALCTSLTAIDVSGFDTSNVGDFNLMFYGCSSLTSLDLSGFVVSDEGASTVEMFNSCTQLSRVELGPDFYFNGASLPTPSGDGYTGYWTTLNSTYVLDASTLSFDYDESMGAMAGTWVWQKQQATVTYNANGGTGTMDPTEQTYTAGGTALTALECGYTNGNRSFFSWNTEADGSGLSFQPGDPVTPGTDITLYAQWSSTATITSIWNTEPSGTRPLVAQYRITGTTSDGRSVEYSCMTQLSEWSSGAESMSSTSNIVLTSGSYTVTVISYDSRYVASSATTATLDLTGDDEASVSFAYSKSPLLGVRDFDGAINKISAA